MLAMVARCGYLLRAIRLIWLGRFRNYCGLIEDREEWLSLGANLERRPSFGLHQLRNCASALPAW